MINKFQMQLLRAISITGLLIIYKPKNTFQFFLGLFLYMGAMFLDYDMFFKNNTKSKDGEVKEWINN